MSAQWTARTADLYQVLESARRRQEDRATVLADDVAAERASYPPDVKRYVWARDCARIAWVTWYLDADGAFPSHWREENAAPPSATLDAAVQP